MTDPKEMRLLRLELSEDMKKLCLAVGKSVDMLAKKHNVSQDVVLEFFIQMIKQVQEEVKDNG